MKDEHKTKKQLVAELAKLRQRIVELETSKAGRKWAAEALRESGQRYKALFEHSNDGVFIFDSNGIYIAVNQRGADMLGYEIDELVGKDAERVVVPEEYADAMQKLGTLLVEPPQPPYERTLLAKDGTRVPTEISIAIVHDAEGHPMHIQSIIRDITERKQAEAALRKSEERYIDLYDNAPDMYFAVKRDGTVLSVNRLGAETLGYQKKELIGQPVVTVFHPDDATSVQQQIDEILKGEEGISKLEFRKIRKDGSVIHVSERVSLQHDPQGEPILRIICRDITERKQAEDALRKSEESLVMAQQVAHIGSWNWYIEADKLTWSDETYRQFGLKPKEITPTYKAFENLVHPDDRELVTQRVEQALSEEKPYSVEARMIRVDGIEWIMHAQGTVYRNKDGKAIRCIGTQQDITERKRAEESLNKLVTVVCDSYDAITVQAF